MRDDISLIKNWHEKAKEDFFSRFMFEYLAFEAFLKKYKYSEGEIRKKAGNIKERSYIQRMKSDKDYAKNWKYLVSINKDLGSSVTELKEFLYKNPLLTNTNWWGCTKFVYNRCVENSSKGVIVNEGDYVNVVEFWYHVRNNLFHAGKNPNNERDEKLVKYAYETLSIFFEKILLPEIENRTVLPAIWEDFEHRFFKGDAELIVKNGKGSACANVYELLFAEDKLFPIFFEGKQIDREYIVDGIKFNLINLYGDPYLLEKEWKNISGRIRKPKDKINIKHYFKDILPLLKDIIPNFKI